MRRKYVLSHNKTHEPRTHKTHKHRQSALFTQKHTRFAREHDINDQEACIHANRSRRYMKHHYVCSTLALPHSGCGPHATALSRRVENAQPVRDIDAPPAVHARDGEARPPRPRGQRRQVEGRGRQEGGGDEKKPQLAAGLWGDMGRYGETWGDMGRRSSRPASIGWCCASSLGRAAWAVREANSKWRAENSGLSRPAIVA